MGNAFLVEYVRLAHKSQVSIEFLQIGHGGDPHSRAFPMGSEPGAGPAQAAEAAALLSGDRKTFEAFRCEAPELVHLPAATFEWYEKNYLNRDYPIRFIMRLNGVVFPDEHTISRQGERT